MRDTRRARLTLGLLLAVALVLITVDHRGGDRPIIGPLRDVTATVFGTVERASAAVTAPITGFFRTVTGAPTAERRIEALERENAALRARLAAQKLDKARAAQLDAMLGLAGLGRYRVLPGQIVARRATPGFEDAVEIDVGASDGVRSDMTVLNHDGLVGRVVRVGSVTSTVLLLTDPALSAGARLEGGDELGVVSGLGEIGNQGNLIRFRLLDSAAPLAAGQRIVSFGSQGGVPYVPGVPIGVIDRVEPVAGELTRIAYARPFANFSALDVVGVVVQAPARDPRDSVLPPGPTPAASPAASPAPSPVATPSPPPVAREQSRKRRKDRRT
jgi:rod shape-determining protein MreC